LILDEITDRLFVAAFSA